MDMNCGKLKKYAFRVTKNRNMASARVRVPGGSLNAKVLGQVQHIAETYGNGEIHLTIRQGFEIMGIPFEKVEEVKKALQPIIDELDINQSERGAGFEAPVPEMSWPASATASAPLATTIRRPWRNGSKRLFSRTTCTSKSPLQAVPTTATKSACMTSASWA